MQILSDLHLEFHPIPEAIKLVEGLPVTDRIVVLAGDIHNKHIARILGAFAQKWELVIYVPGNHDYYGERLRYQHQRFQRIEEAHPNVKILRNKIYTDPVSGITFAGTTLWFPWSDAALRAQGRLNDFRCIKESNSIFRWNGEAKDFLVNAAFSEDPVDVVVTHHAPSKLAINPQYVDDDLNECYMTPMMDHPILEFGGKIWIHGHTHVSHDFQHPAGGRIIANCAGYDWDVPNFDPARVYTL